MANISKESLEKAVKIINDLEEDREHFATSYEDAIVDLKSLNKQLNELTEDLKKIKSENELLKTKEHNSTVLLKEFYYANKELEKQLKEAKAIQTLDKRSDTITADGTKVKPSIKGPIIFDEQPKSDISIDEPENIDKRLNLGPTYNINYYV